MSTNVITPAIASVSTRECSFCNEAILADARKCKHCGEFVKQRISKSVGAIFAAGVMIACVLAGMLPASSEGVITVGVWSIFALLFASTFARG